MWVVLSRRVEQILNSLHWPYHWNLILFIKLMLTVKFNKELLISRRESARSWKLSRHPSTICLLQMNNPPRSKKKTALKASNWHLIKLKSSSATWKVCLSSQIRQRKDNCIRGICKTLSCLKEETKTIWKEWKLIWHLLWAIKLIWTHWMENKGLN
jgi:hypothetical protein